MKIRKMKCFKCSVINDVITYEELEVNHPQVLDGSLFSIVCKNCKTKNYFDYPLILQSPIGMIAYKQEISQAKRWVFKQDDLIEKANIISDGFDDRVIEVMKLYMRKRIIDTPIIHYIQSNQDFLEFRIIKDNKAQRMTQSIHAYDQLNKRLTFDDNEKEIDYQWALKHFEEFNLTLYFKDKH